MDSRQVMMVLNNEPRFLSITPDTGQLELSANETSPLVRDFMLGKIDKQDKSDTKYVAVPLVTAVWFQEASHVPSPAIHIHENDGTQVTNFPDSLALWAQVNDSDRTAMFDLVEGSSEKEYAAAKAKEQQYWGGIRKAVRAAEKKRPSQKEAKKHGPPWKCKKTVRFGVSNETARVNYPFTVQEITESLQSIGYTVDYETGEVHSIDENEAKSEL